MKQELSFKQQKMEHSKQTLELLGKDLEKRKGELQKINDLDKKINLELASSKEKIQQMQQEMAAFKSNDELAADARQAKTDLQAKKLRTQKQHDAIKQQVCILFYGVSVFFNGEFPLFPVGKFGDFC